MENNITLSWTKSELVTYISNHSAFVAQSLSLSGDVAFDYNTLTEDNEKTYLDDKISEAINTLVPHFARIIDDDADVLEGDKYGLVFTPRIEGGSYSKAELSHIKTLCRKFIASYILADWYSMKGIAAMNNYFVAQSTQSSAELNVVLNRFVRPVRKASVNVGRVSYVSKANADYTHINNRSDFALVWGTANGAPLPNGEYDVDFYTDGEVIRSFNSLDTDVVKPIENNPNKVRIIFDFSDGNYFANGVLKYTMRGSIQDADFLNGKRYFEQSGETTIEIWDGASDADGKVSATFIPSYMKLQFSDLTPEDIATLQAPALEAAEVADEATATANSAAADALSRGNYAKEQGDYAQNQGSYARSQAENAYAQANKAQKVANDWTGENGGVGYKSIIEKTISDAEDTIDAKVQEVDDYLLGASQAEYARAESESARVRAEEDRAQVFAEKISESEKATASANSAAARAEKKANEVGEALENLDETLATKQDTLNLTILDNGNIRISNLSGGSRDFMPATPSGDPMHYAYEMAGATYNVNTNTWTVNGITDITPTQMKEIHDFGHFRLSDKMALSSIKIRTCYRRIGSSNVYSTTFDLNSFVASSSLEAISFSIGATPQQLGATEPYEGVVCIPVKTKSMFHNCIKMKAIYGRLKFLDTDTIDSTNFYNCSVLERVAIYQLCGSIKFSDSPLLSKESLLYMITKCESDKSFTIILHPEIYAKCVEDGEWYSDVSDALNTVASDKNTMISLGQ